MKLVDYNEMKYDIFFLKENYIYTYIYIVGSQFVAQA